MDIKFINKDTGKIIIPESGRDLIIIDNKLYEAEFGSADSLELNHIYNGEAWLLNINWGIIIS